MDVFLCLRNNNNRNSLCLSGRGRKQNRRERDERARQETHLQAVRVAMGGADGKAEVLSRVQDKSVE